MSTNDFIKATIYENDSLEEFVAATFQVDIRNYQFNVFGGDGITSHGIAIYIHDYSAITAKKYEFVTDPDHPDYQKYGGHYNAKVDGNSWLSTTGFIELTEYNATDKKMKGTFEFVAKSDDQKNTATLKGSFDLEKPVQTLMTFLHPLLKTAP